MLCAKLFTMDEKGRLLVGYPYASVPVGEVQPTSNSDENKVWKITDEITALLEDRKTVYKGGWSRIFVQVEVDPGDIVENLGEWGYRVFRYTLTQLARDQALTRREFLQEGQ